MKRRDVLTGLFSGVAFATSNGYLWHKANDLTPREFGDAGLTLSEPEQVILEDSESVGTVTAEMSQKEYLAAESLRTNELPADIGHIDSARVAVANTDKVRFFENEFLDDVFLTEQERPILASVLQRLENVQKVVGHGNFNLLAFDDMLKIARGFDSVGEFTAIELDFMEKIFFTEAKNYGFYGEKVTEKLTVHIPDREVVRVPYTGHFVFKGQSQVYYDKLLKDVGPQIVLTSGIRSVVKQMHLFLAKCDNSNGNLSKASRSLAPPGHSFHGIGDFDVGRLGWGLDNFTSKFAGTDEYKKMQDLGYVKIRYTEDNQLGVRFEPWHIMVV